MAGFITAYAIEIRSRNSYLCDFTSHLQVVVTPRNREEPKNSPKRLSITQEKNATRSWPSSRDLHVDAVLSSPWWWAKDNSMTFGSLKTAVFCCIPMPCCWRIRDTKGCTNTIRTRPCRSKRKKANPFQQKTKPITRHYQNSVFSLSMSIADAKYSGLLRMFIGASTEITR
jgi:hypothetical protein